MLGCNSSVVGDSTPDHMILILTTGFNCGLGTMMKTNSSTDTRHMHVYCDNAYSYGHTYVLTRCGHLPSGIEIPTRQGAQ